MSDTSKNLEQKKASASGAALIHRVSLVELIFILLLVGLVFVFFFGMQQLKEDKARELIAHEKFEQIVPAIRASIAAAEEYRRTDDFGEYPFDFSQLNIPADDSYSIVFDDETGSMLVDAEDFVISYDGEDYRFIAESTESFGKAGVKVIYTLRDASYEVDDPTPERRPTVLDEWLPQD